VVKPVSDALRTRQRDALVAYLLGRHGLSDPDQLYEFLLIDVLTAPCATTSRLLAATGAVQLFVHRCLIGLEPRVPGQVIDPDRWDWMKTYRVWEANRRVLLYPQNYLHPELRDDASVAFRAAEAALMDTEPTSGAGDVAINAYLDALVEVSRIQVLGMYDHDRGLSLPDSTGRTAVRALYLVGRTPDEPHRYYWRVCEDFGGLGQHWHGWERLDLDITGTHVLPFVLGGALHVAWALLTRKDPPASGTSGTEQWELRFGWSRLGRDGWSDRKLGPPLQQSLNTPSKRDQRRSFAFRVQAPAVVPLDPGLPGLDVGATREAVTITCYQAVGEPIPGTRLTPKDDGIDLSGKHIGEWEFHFQARVLWKASIDHLTDVYWPAKGAQVRLILDNAGLALPASQGIATKDWVFLLSGDVEDPKPVPKWLTGNKIAAIATFAGTAGSPKKVWPPTAQFEGQIVNTANYHSKTWDIDLVLDWPGPAPPDVVPTRTVTMAPRAWFGIYADRDSEWRDGVRDTLAAPVGTEYLDNGYAIRGQSIVNLHGRTLTASGTDALLIPANPSGSSAWHFADAQQAYLVDLVPPGDWIFLSDGLGVAHDLRALAARDLRDLYDVPVQQATDGGRSLRRLAPTPAELEHAGHPAGPGSSSVQGIVFDTQNPSALYNWELFLHLPLLVAQAMREQQRFDESRSWLNRVLDPAAPDVPGVSADRRYWKFAPFRAAGRPDRMDDVVNWLANPLDTHEQKRDFARQIAEWRRHPFRPHDIARLRPGAYQWSTFFSYVDTLLEAGDAHFRRDTRESLVDATMMYVQADSLLGARPVTDSRTGTMPALSYRGVAGKWDDLSNTWLQVLDTELVRELVAALASSRQHGVGGASGVPSDLTALANLGMTYFCVPANEKLTEYRDRVDDRLFKIRHCQNIDGVSRDLPLLSMRIDPDVLVRAVAAGIGLDQAISDLQGPVSQYRYAVLAQRAVDLAAEARSLGAEVLAALEKRDAEHLSNLRAAQEVALLDLVASVRIQQLSEAETNVDALTGSRKAAVSRWKHYYQLATLQTPAEPAPGGAIVELPSNLVLSPVAGPSDTGGLGLITAEGTQLAWMEMANNYTVASGIFNAVAGLQYIVSASNPLLAFLQGLGHATTSVSALLGALSTNANHQAGRDSLLAGYQRRRDEWVFQANSAAYDIEQIDKQIAAAGIRQTIAQNELDNHRTQVQHALDTEEFLRSKYTNEQLYTWMSSRLSAAHLSAYQLALDTARQAERAFRYELAQPEARFVQARYWESQRQGLLAGERLVLDIKRMDSAYLAGNRRELELTRPVSVLRLSPQALVDLRVSGHCEFEIPESMYDVDSPGCYMRRLKSVSVSIPCVVGRFASVHGRLTLLKSETRHRPDVTAGGNAARDYPRSGLNDQRFTDDLGAIESIVTSGAVDASGLWEVALRDERRLPFEGKGAISRWRLELPGDLRAFDYDTISDVILTIRYSARDGGESLRDAAVGAAKAAIGESGRWPQEQLISLRHEYPSEWARLSARAAGEEQKFTIARDRFPHLFTGQDITVTAVDAYTVGSTEGNLPVVSTSTAPPMTWASPAPGKEAGLRHASLTKLSIPVPSTMTWSVRAPAVAMSHDLVLVLTYMVTPPKSQPS
jgi:hypothetical protein